MPAVFVHGITVRKDRFDTLLKTIQKGFRKKRPDVALAGFYWGDMASSLRFGGASIPGFLEGKRALAEAAVALDGLRQLTTLLLDDPLLELRLLRDPVEFDPAGAGFVPMPPGVEQRNQTLASAGPRVADALARDAELSAAAGKVVGEGRWREIVKAAFDAAGKADRALTPVDLIDPLTRSLSASLYLEVEGTRMVLDSTFRWNDAAARVQQTLEASVGGQRGWIGNKLKELAGGAAAHTVTFTLRHGLRRRLMESTSIFLGDVLAYMAKRDQIQAELENAVASTLAESPGPLWLVGHSLGGIVCFDHCLRTTRKVERLITVGSQVGLFGELGVFPGLQADRAGALKTPACVQKWINVYDPDDVLSFLAAPVMTGVVDVEFDTGAPFPASHSEYWNCELMYERLVQ